MLELHPPRRDPRLFLLDLQRRPIVFAALDAWEVRGLGTLPVRGATLAFDRLLLQLRPSHVALVARGTPPAGLRRALRNRGIALVVLAPRELRPLLARTPSIAVLRASYPELRHLAATALRHELHALRAALAVLLHHPLHPRRYVPGLSLRPAPRLDR